MDEKSPANDFLATVQTLVALGAPLAGWSPRTLLSPENAFVSALRFASKNAFLLRALPVVLARNWRSLDWAVLEESARAMGVLDRLGMVTELTGSLAGMPELTATAKRWWQPPAQTSYFFPPRNAFDKELAELRTPDVARRWGFLMNMGEDSFRDLFRRHVG